MADPFRSDRSWRFDVGRDELWERIAATDDFPSWWPWLREFEATGALATHERWSCVVSPPLPYTVRFDVAFDLVDPARLVHATVTGDIGGQARLLLDDDGDGSVARLVSSLRPTNVFLRGFGLVARPLVEHGHDWILDEGRKQFVERAFEAP